MNADTAEIIASTRGCCRVRWKVLAAASVLLLAAAVWPTVKIVRIKAAIARVKAAGGKAVAVCSPNYQNSGFLRCYSLVIGDSKFCVVLNGSRITDADLNSLESLDGLVDLRLDDTAVTDAGLRCLPDHHGLQRLSLDDCAIDDAGLAVLRDMADLRSLNLARTKVSDAGLRQIAGMTKLQFLILAGTHVTDAGISCVRASRNFRRSTCRIPQSPTRGCKTSKGWPASARCV